MEHKFHLKYSAGLHEVKNFTKKEEVKDQEKPAFPLRNSFLLCD